MHEKGLLCYDHLKLQGVELEQNMIKKVIFIKRLLYPDSSAWDR